MPIDKKKKIAPTNLIGVIPAAGTGSRLGPLPCSKELLPVGFHNNRSGEQAQPKVVCHYLLERMQKANVSQVYIILRKGKWDIPDHFGDGKKLDMHIAYLLMDLPFGVPYTLDQAYPFIKNSTVVFGFPDIIFKPVDAFAQLLKKQVDSDANIVLGLFPTKQTKKADMIEFDRGGCIKRINIKPDSTNLLYAWIIAVWGPDFTEFLHEYILNRKKELNRKQSHNDPMNVKELFMGEVIQAGIRKDLKLDSVIFKDGNYIDIGTTEDLAKVTNESWV
jgi:glucose-1-phosphate thymidylyltransferase